MERYTISRRRILQLSVPVTGILYSGGLSALVASCKNKATAKAPDTATPQHPRKPKKTPVQRGNPYAGRDEMFLHTKSRTLHYPFVFKTYGKMKEEHITAVNSADWAKQLDENGAHFARHGSALIFERLAFRKLSPALNNDNLAAASSVLARSFTADYAKQNVYNWRGYHLLFQLVALNSGVPVADKWPMFSNAVKQADVSHIKKIPKRHGWIVSQQLFDQRVQYVQQHNEEYTNRLKKRLV